MLSQAYGHFTPRNSAYLSRFTKAALAAFFLFIVSPVQALGPHECVILVNRNSMGSLEVANFYADLRKIPPQNIIHLDIPESFREAASTISPDDFLKYIYDPASRMLAERKLLSHALVWLYSLDFPSTVQTTPPMSLTGMTFVRGRPPPTDEAKTGFWLSPMFHGPDRAEGSVSPSFSLEQFTLRLTTNMPLPSMMLGWSGSRGMTVEQIKQSLRRAAASDGTHPTSPLFFEVNDNVRSTTRAWQFAPATRELAEQKIEVIATPELPGKAAMLMGVLAGRSDLIADEYGMLGAGAYADHLTSFGALFNTSEQTKMTAWLRHGAAGSAGTIVEPGSLEYPVMLWAKFPSARLFAHYARGCTLIESLYQATRSPLQLLFIGDALCSPWAKSPAVTLINLSETTNDVIRGDVEFMTTSLDPVTNTPPVIMYLLNGRPVQTTGRNTAHFNLRSRALSDGHHDLRAIAYKNEAIRHQGFANAVLEVNNRKRYVNLSGYRDGQKVDLYHPLVFSITAGEEEPGEVAIIAQERILARAPYSQGTNLTVQPMLTGAGPVVFQAAAVYNGRESVRSTPLLLNIEALNQPPAITSTTISTNQAEEITLEFMASDQDDRSLTSIWLANLMVLERSPLLSPDESISRGELLSGQLKLSAAKDRATATWNVDQPNQIKEIHSRFRLEGDKALQMTHQGGLVFNYLDENNYFYWGIDGQLGAWSLKHIRDGQEMNVLTRGNPIELNRDYVIMAIVVAPGKVAFFVNDQLEAIADVTFGPGRVGLRAGTEPVIFDELLVAPATAVRSIVREEQSRLIIPEIEKPLIDSVYIGARDVQFTVTRAFEEED